MTLDQVSVPITRRLLAERKRLAASLPAISSRSLTDAACRDLTTARFLGSETIFMSFSSTKFTGPGPKDTGYDRFLLVVQLRTAALPSKQIMEPSARRTHDLAADCFSHHLAPFSLTARNCFPSWQR